MKYPLPAINLRLIRSSVEADHMRTAPIPTPGQHVRAQTQKHRHGSWAGGGNSLTHSNTFMFDSIHASTFQSCLITASLERDTMD